MSAIRVPDYELSQYSFGFVNSFDKPFSFQSSFGKISLGKNAGLCGGMTFASLDYYATGRSAPDELTDALYDYLCERQTDSLDLPEGVIRYLSWQASYGDSTMMFGKRILEGISYSTLTTEWPKIQALLDGGHLAPLALIKTDSSSPKELSKNHQVLAYGYIANEQTQILTLQVYDPNYPRDHNITLRMGMGNPDFFRPIFHSAEMSESPIRGFFLSNYVEPKNPPDE
jgi:hypothetical protein